MRDVTTTVFANITKEPEIGKNKDGTLKVRLGLAINSQYFDREKGKYLERPTQFASAFVRGALARNVLKSVHKGEPVLVHGRVSLNQWEDDDGGTAKVFLIDADGVGHDLQFGTTELTKPPRPTDPPMGMDPDTGEIHEMVQGLPEDDPDGQDEREDEPVPAVVGASVPF